MSVTAVRSSPLEAAEQGLRVVSGDAALDVAASAAADPSSGSTVEPALTFRRRIRLAPSARQCLFAAGGGSQAAWPQGIRFDFNDGCRGVILSKGMHHWLSSSERSR